MGSCKQADYYLTQILPRHGSFHAYLKMLGVAGDDSCIYCNEKDTAENTFFECRWWENLRDLQNIEINVKTLVSTMLESENRWKTVQTLMRSIIKQKSYDGNRLQ